MTSRGGFLALEAIHDHVKSLAADPVTLERYLSSGAATPDA